MASERYNTLNPVLDIEVVRGGLSAEELRRRTLSFTYIDRAHKYDEIEWQLENGDGVVTRPENLVVGLTVRFRMGYLGDTFPWKAMIVNRIKGGVGVYGQKDSGVSEADGKVTFRGRNRNAPTPKGKKGKTAQPTSDVLGYEMLNPKKSSVRSFPNARTPSDVAKSIAEASGFTSDYQLIEDTSQLATFECGYSLGQGESYLECMSMLAESLEYVFKVDHRGFRFHSPRWAPVANKGIRETFEYAADQDSLQIEIDGDFLLPLPEKVTVKSVDLMNRWINSGDVSAAQQGQVSNFSAVMLQGLSALGKKERQQNLLRDEVIVAGPNMAMARATAQFIRRHTNKLKLKATVVGNPRVLSCDLVRIKRTGNQIVDGIWSVDEARHTWQQAYSTILTLKQPPAAVKRHTDILWFNTGDPVAAQQGQQNNFAAVAVKGIKALSER